MIKNHNEFKSKKSLASIKLSNSNDKIFDSNNYSIKSKSQKSILDDYDFRTQSSPNLNLPSEEYFQIDNIASETSLNQINTKSLFSKNSDKLFNDYFDQLITKWTKQKNLYLTIQKIFVIIDFILTLVILGLSLWVNIDDYFVIITNMANSILYSSFNRVMSFLAYEFLSISSVSLILDLINLFSLIFVKKLLKSHTPGQIYSIVQNQRILVNIKNDFNSDHEVETLKRRVKIRKNLKTVLLNLKFLISIQFILNMSVFLGAGFFNAIYLHFKMNYILSYELPQTLIKVIREYEKQQRLAIIKKEQSLFRFENLIVNSTEENLINRINSKFNCCNYQNPYQYGDLAPLSCNYGQGCLKPMQEFLWNYLYGTVIVLLFVGSLKFLIQIVLFFNFYLIFLRRLIRKIYFVNIRRLVDNETDDSDRGIARNKLDKIRKQKEAQLSKEEEEEVSETQVEFELSKNLDLDKKQEEYEKKLFKQKRFKELRYEQMQRRLQAQHLLDMNDDF
ncbi:unnamed protein product [Brachionus calyciflorus]|uniref:Transmembrane protein n=1 Tax=Brachionus calyciflorus TaxID=104777 RepID=A0A813YIP3_9BILA|nr:unnamed protein product [Brachionus calyciflorus]